MNVPKTFFPLIPLKDNDYLWTHAYMSSCPQNTSSIGHLLHKVYPTTRFAVNHIYKIRKSNHFSSFFFRFKITWIPNQTLGP